MKSCTYYEHDFSQFDELKFVNDFDVMDWSNIHDDKTDLDKKLDDFHAKVSSCVEENASLKKVSKRQLTLKLKPWINKEVVKIIRKRDKIHNQLKCNPTDKNISEFYKKFRHKVVYITRKSRSSYYQDFFMSNQNNMRKLWTGIKSIVKVKQKSIVQISQLYQNGEFIKDPKSVANVFDNFFCECWKTY